LSVINLFPSEFAPSYRLEPKPKKEDGRFNASVVTACGADGATGIEEAEAGDKEPPDTPVGRLGARYCPFCDASFLSFCETGDESRN